MSPFVRAFALVIAGLLTVAACALAGAPADAARGSILLLKNGRVLRGYITPLGDHFLVALDERNEVRVPATQVEMHCPTIQDAYARRRAVLPAGKIDAHLDLADWCLRQELVAEAAEQLEDAAAIEPAHARLELMRLRLQIASKPPATIDITPRRMAAPTDEVNDSVQALPADAVAQFTTTIQPILMNRCGAAACHGPTSDSSFLLLRPSWAKSLPQRLTHRNLHATIQLVDRDQPELSALVRYCREPHGKAAEPIFGDADHYQWRQVTVWLNGLARRAPASPPLAFAPPETILSRSLPNASRDLPDGDGQTSQAAEGQPEDSSVGEATPASTSLTPRPLPAPFRPRDPFDPEIFNRRFFPAASESTAR